MILDYLWDRATLHALTGLHEVTVPVIDFAWHLDLPFWANGGKPFKVRPSAVAADRSRYPAQWERTMAADLRFALHARTRSTGQVVILDGIHRLLKASILGWPTVNVRLLTEANLDDIAIAAPR